MNAHEFFCDWEVPHMDLDVDKLRLEVAAYKGALRLTQEMLSACGHDTTWIMVVLGYFHNEGNNDEKTKGNADSPVRRG